MAAKVLLAALISLGALIVGVATVHVVLSESTASAAHGAVVASECGAGSGSECSEAARRGHVAWNAASWLVGLALVVAIGRRSAQPSSD